MSLASRAAVTVASLLCVASVATVSAPSFATEIAGSGSATAMLAAVTAPLLAVDVQTLEARKTDFSSSPVAADPAIADTPPTASSLEDLVARNTARDAASEDDKCLATSVYFESKGEPLAGQLAVAQTILNRTTSGRFADSVCGVVRQPGQFSFLHGSDMPDAPHSDAWARAVAIARIAREGLWKQIAPAALYFHARRVSPGWGRVRIASVGNHIFFR